MSLTRPRPQPTLPHLPLASLTCGSSPLLGQPEQARRHTSPRTLDGKTGSRPETQASPLSLIATRARQDAAYPGHRSGHIPSFPRVGGLCGPLPSHLTFYMIRGKTSKGKYLCLWLRPCPQMIPCAKNWAFPEQIGKSSGVSGGLASCCCGSPPQCWWCISVTLKRDRVVPSPVTYRKVTFSL